MKENCHCVNCKYYTKHYVKQNGKYRMINYGHCSNTKIKIKRPHEVCGFWNGGYFDIITKDN